MSKQAADHRNAAADWIEKAERALDRGSFAVAALEAAIAQAHASLATAISMEVLVTETARANYARSMRGE